MANFWSRLMTAAASFRESFLASDTIDSKDFSDFDARKMRYQIFWAFYENNAYRDIHSWAQLFRHDFGLYRYVRNIYNPAYRLGEFWKAHLLAGPLDPDAGDGKLKPSALPIITDNEALRPAIAQIWKWSNWFIKKDILSLWGSVLGDAFIRINDVPYKERVYLTLVHPGTVKETVKDDWGNIKSYVIEELWDNPERTASKKKLVYNEVAYRAGDFVVYETFLDDKPYNSAINPETGQPTNWWMVPYGFVPLVQVQHNNVGLEYGWSEFHAAISKIRESDDMASKLNDQIRKMVDAPWLFAGVEDPKKKSSTGTAPKTTSQAGTTTNPEDGREKIPALYGPPDASAQALVTDLSISDTSGHIDSLLKELERDFPELGINLQNSNGDISGRALRAHREPVDDKVNLRRVGYDDAIVRAQQMAISIAGYRQYPGFEAFNLDSFKAGALDHEIGERPVFAKDKLDTIEIDKAFWELIKSGSAAGAGLEFMLQSQGMSADQIKLIVESPEYQAKLAGFEAAKQLSDTISSDPAKFQNNQNHTDDKTKKTTEKKTVEKKTVEKKTNEKKTGK